MRAHAGGRGRGGVLPLPGAVRLAYGPKRARGPGGGERRIRLLSRPRTVPSPPGTVDRRARGRGRTARTRVVESGTQGRASSGPARGGRGDPNGSGPVRGGPRRLAAGAGAREPRFPRPTRPVRGSARATAASSPPGPRPSSERDRHHFRTSPRAPGHRGRTSGPGRPARGSPLDADPDRGRGRPPRSGRRRGRLGIEPGDVRPVLRPSRRARSAVHVPSRAAHGVLVHPGGAAFDRAYLRGGRGRELPGALTFGVNPAISRAPEVGEIAAGTVGLLLGGNRSLGGRNPSRFAYLTTLGDAKVDLDGEPFLEEGTLVPRARDSKSTGASVE